LSVLLVFVSAGIAVPPDTVTASPDELWNYALEHSPALMVETERLLAVEETSRGVGRLNDPMFRVSWAPMPVETRNGPVDFSFMLMQKIPWPGLLVEQRTKAMIMNEIAELDLFRRKLELKTLIVSKLADIIVLKNTISFLEDELVRYNAILQIAEAMYETGSISLAKLYMLENRITRTESAVYSKSLMLEALNAEMLSIIGGTDDTVIIYPGTYSPPENIFSYTLEEIDISRSPAIRGKLLQMELAESEERISGASGLPSFEAGINWSVVGEPSVDMGAVNPGEGALVIFAGLSLPLGYSGRGNRTEAARIASGATEYDYLQTVMNVNAELTAYLSVIAGRNNEYRNMTNTVIPNLESIISLTETAWINGMVTLEEVMKAISDYGSAQVELIEIQTEMMTVQTLLEELCGIETKKEETQ